jgi:hypothetical protein
MTGVAYWILSRDTGDPKEVTLSTTAVATIKRQPWRPGDFIENAGHPVIGLVAGQEDPRAGLDRVGVGHRVPNRFGTDLASSIAIVPSRILTGIITELAPPRLL